jgi:diketogulonate reductase-like aldo/keto reductase
MLTFNIKRRRFLNSVGVMGFGLPALAGAASNAGAYHSRIIPSSGQKISAIGMGSWLTYDIDINDPGIEERVAILQHFFAAGGEMIDSSPMYGRSEAVIGKCLAELGHPKKTFSATKVWTRGRDAGIAQMHRSETLWQTPRFNLMQIHNLLDWQAHIETLIEWKKQRKVQYIGITTYGGLDHGQIIKILRQYPLDFVQMTYNIVDRAAEKTIIPVALEQGVAVIANRPFREGRLFELVRGKSLPSWAKDYQCENWAQFFLKFLLANPGVTCAIPATSQLVHMKENMAALLGPIPGLKARDKMLRYFNSIS